VRIPAVAMAAAFISGMLVGLGLISVRVLGSHAFLAAGFVAAGSLILAGLLSLRIRWLGFAAGTSLLSWILLGVLAAAVAQEPLPGNHVVRLAESGQLDLGSPLRWRGTLRDEPARLPWGYGYDIELNSVDYQGRTLPLRGGMRLSFSQHGDDRELPDLHCGDTVEISTLARRPQVFKDEGAFDRRGYLATQNIDLTATLRAPELIERTERARVTPGALVARARRSLRDEIDLLFGNSPQIAGVLRAMLVGDRSFVDRAESVDFQKTGIFHVLVVAGLHVGAVTALLFWLGRKLRMSRSWTIVFVLTLLSAYVAVVEQRAPVLRAASMAGIVVIGAFFYRRLELLNSAALAAIALLVARPLALRDSSFQLTFVAIGCIGGLATPWIRSAVQPYSAALRGWRDVTRDVSHQPRVAQFRLDLRSALQWVSAGMPKAAARAVENTVVGAMQVSLRTWELLALTMVLQIGMLPLIARDFHRIALAAPLVNLFAVPLTGLIVPVGFVTVACGLLFPVVGRTLALPLRWLTALLMHLVQWAAHFSRWTSRVPGPPLWLVMIFFAILVALMLAIRRDFPKKSVVVRTLGVGFACSVLAVAIFPFSPSRAAGKLETTILDVGQGDSLLVVTPGGQTMLIDGGGAFGGFPGQEEHNGIDPGEEAVSPYLWSRGFQKLDVVALTHAHQDHLGGLTAILENFQVGELWIGREVASTALLKLEELARAHHVRIEHEIRGRRFSWDGVEGEFLWPEIAANETAPATAKNNDSLVLRLHYGDRTLLLPGDAEKAVERALLRESPEDELRADVLKVGHHGSKNSTTLDFLTAVRPSVAIISAGENNPYGHPSPEAIERLAGAGARILRTDRDGAIHIVTDGKRLEISCFVPCSEGGLGVAQNANREIGVPGSAARTGH
jgi:competence protein ComEC